MNRRGLTPQGFALIAAMGLITMLTMVGTTMLTRATSEQRISLVDHSFHQAFHLAEAAADLTLAQLQAGDFDGLDRIDTGPAAYWSEVEKTGENLDGYPIYRVNAYGQHGAAMRHVELLTQLRPTSVFRYALFADKQLWIDNDAWTDSYDSRLGRYEDSPRGQEGNVGTNANTQRTSEGELTVNFGNTATIFGQVVIGPDGDPTPVTGADSYFERNTTGVVVINNWNPKAGNHRIMGVPPIVAAPQPFSLSPVEVPTGLVCAPGTTTIKNDRWGRPPPLLPSGTYCFHNLTVERATTFASEGPVQIYITGKLTVNNYATVGASSRRPAHMMFLVAPSPLLSGESHSIGGTASFYGSFYAHAEPPDPPAKISVGNTAKIYGSIIADIIKVDNRAQLHYDVSLAEEGGPGGYYRARVLLWNEHNEHESIP